MEKKGTPYKNREDLTLLDIETLEGTLIARPSGELDVHTAPKLKAEIERQLLLAPVRSLMISLKNVTFIDSSGLGALLGRYRRMVELGGKLILVAIPARIRPILELSGVMKIIPVFESEKKALERI